VIQLPKGATPIDFAFAVHTEVGLHCQGARINGRIASLARELKNSETVEIITSPSAKPSRDWLAHVRTGRATSRECIDADTVKGVVQPSSGHPRE